jgi:hypothetical protein
MNPTHSQDRVASEPDDHGANVSHMEPDNIGVAVLTVLFAFVAVVIVLVVVLLQAWFYNWKVDLLAERMGPIDEQQTPAAIAKMQIERIETTGWADPKTKKDWTIPIEQAMKSVVSEHSADVEPPAANGKENDGK